MNALKTKILLLLLLSCSLGMYAQNKLGYTYDDAGNRVKREIVMSRTQSQVEKCAIQHNYHKFVRNSSKSSALPLSLVIFLYSLCFI